MGFELIGALIARERDVFEPQINGEPPCPCMKFGAARFSLQSLFSQCERILHITRSGGQLTSCKQRIGVAGCLMRGDQVRQDIARPLRIAGVCQLCRDDRPGA